MRRMPSSMLSVIRRKVLTGLSMSLEAWKSRPNPTFPITSKLSLCAHTWASRHTLMGYKRTDSGMAAHLPQECDVNVRGGPKNLPSTHLHLSKLFLCAHTCGRLPATHTSDPK